MSAFDWNIFMRGASFGLAALFFVLVMRQPERRLRLLGGGLALSVTAYLFIGGGLAAGWPMEIRAGLRMVAALGPFCFWALSRSLFEESFRLRRWHALIVAAMLFAAMFRVAGENSMLDGGFRPANPGLILLAAVLVLHAMWRVLRDYDIDLVEPRRRFRWIFLLAGGSLALTSLAMHWLLRSGYVQAAEARLFQASVFLLLKVALAVQVIGFSGLAQPVAAGPGTADSEPEPGAENDDTLQSDRIAAAMQHDGLYLKTGLTIVELARHLGLPEYRVRRLINRHQGYRNFNDFLNYWRLAEAMKRLADPQLARIPILSIALDLGYGSIGPFNRAFKARTGLTPSEYRRAHGGNAVPGS